MKENFVELFRNFESLSITSDSVQPKFGPFNFTKLQYTFPPVLKQTAEEWERQQAEEAALRKQQEEEDRLKRQEEDRISLEKELREKRALAQREAMLSKQ